MTHMQCRNNVH